MTREWKEVSIVKTVNIKGIEVTCALTGSLVFAGPALLMADEAVDGSAGLGERTQMAKIITVTTML